MSHYYCSEHGDDPDASCVTCDAAREWIDKDERIAELEAELTLRLQLLGEQQTARVKAEAQLAELREALRNILKVADHPPQDIAIGELARAALLEVRDDDDRT